jgi:hypothetical protein
MVAVTQPPQKTMPMPPTQAPNAQLSLNREANWAATQPNAGMGQQAPAGTTPPMPPNPSPPMPPTGGDTAMNPAPGQYSQWGNNPQQVTPPNLQDFMNVTPPDLTAGMQGVGDWSGINPKEKNFYGGQQIAGADPSQADYGSVQGYADQAYQQARRNLDPMQAQQTRRMEQDLINKGVDPTSAQGKGMLDQMQRQQADQNAAASFGALQFGQGIQNQMAQQEQQKAQLAGNMQQALMQNQLGASGQGLQYALGQMQNQLGLAGLQNQKYGMDLQSQLGHAGLQNQLYGMDLQHQMGMGNLDYQRGMGEHSQLMDLLGYDMNVAQMNQQNQLIQDALWNQQFGATPIPGMGSTNPYSPAGTMLGAGDTKWWNANVSGGTPW